MAKRAPPPEPARPGAAAGRIVVPVAPTCSVLDATALGVGLANRLAGRRGVTVVCDLAAVRLATLATLQAVAIVGLATRRHHGTLLVRNTSPQVRDALALFGLWDEWRMSVDPVQPRADDADLPAPAPRPFSPGS